MDKEQLLELIIQKENELWEKWRNFSMDVARECFAIAYWDKLKYEFYISIVVWATISLVVAIIWFFTSI